MRRKRFNETQVIETLANQGIFVACYRCGEFFFARDQHGYVKRLRKIEREHLHELALGGADAPHNCRYSCGQCHAKITNGTKATTAGSSKQRIAKVKRLEAAKTDRLEEARLAQPESPARKWPSRPWPTRKLTHGRKFPPRGSRPMNKKRRA